MATTTPTTVTVKALLLRAAELLQGVHEALQEAAAIVSPEYQVAALRDASQALFDDVMSDVAKFGEQADSHVTLRAQHMQQQQPAPVLVMQSAAQVTEPAAPQYDQHVLDYRAGQAAEHRKLLDEARSLGLKVARTWKSKTIACHIAGAKLEADRVARVAAAKAQATTPAPVKPEPVATAPQHTVAATAAKTVQVDVPLDREAAVRALLGMSQADFASFAGLLATPVVKAA